MLRYVLVLVAVCASIASFAACEGDGPSSAVTTPPVTTQPTAASTTVILSTPDTRRTGIASVDAAIDANLAGDASAIRRMLRFTPIGCIVEPQGIGAPPFCRPGEILGTVISVLPEATCEREYRRPDEILDDSLTTDGLRLYAVYRANADTYPPGKYAAIFLRKSIPEGVPAVSATSLLLDDSGITGIHYGCNQTPEQFVESQHLTNAIWSPQ